MCFHQSFTGVHSVKRSETLHGTIIAKERRNGEGLGRFGSGQVGSNPHLFSVRPEVCTVYCALLLQAKFFEKAVLSLDKL